MAKKLGVKEAMKHFVSTNQGAGEPGNTIKKLTKQALDPTGQIEGVQNARTIADIWEAFAIAHGYEPDDEGDESVIFDFAFTNAESTGIDSIKMAPIAGTYDQNILDFNKEYVVEMTLNINGVDEPIIATTAASNPSHLYGDDNTVIYGEITSTYTKLVDGALKIYDTKAELEFNCSTDLADDPSEIQSVKAVVKTV